MEKTVVGNMCLLRYTKAVCFLDQGKYGFGVAGKKEPVTFLYGFVRGDGVNIPSLPGDFHQKHLLQVSEPCLSYRFSDHPGSRCDNGFHQVFIQMLNDLLHAFFPVRQQSAGGKGKVKDTRHGYQKAQKEKIIKPQKWQAVLSDQAV